MLKALTKKFRDLEEAQLLDYNFDGKASHMQFKQAQFD
jgi:hypothetical protein